MKFHFNDIPLIINFFFLNLFQVTKEELAKLVQGFDKQEILTSGGVTLAGSRYIYLSGSDRVVRAKLGRNGVHCMKTQQGEWDRQRDIMKFVTHLKMIAIAFLFPLLYVHHQL